MVNHDKQMIHTIPNSRSRDRPEFDEAFVWLPWCRGTGAAANVLRPATPGDHSLEEIPVRCWLLFTYSSRVSSWKNTLVCVRCGLTIRGKMHMCLSTRGWTIRLVCSLFMRCSGRALHPYQTCQSHKSSLSAYCLEEMIRRDEVWSFHSW